MELPPGFSPVLLTSSVQALLEVEVDKAPEGEPLGERPSRVRDQPLEGQLGCAFTPS